MTSFRLTLLALFSLYVLFSCMTSLPTLAAGDTPTRQEADAFYQQQQWKHAAAAYRVLLPELAGTEAIAVRLRLAFALQSSKEHAGALAEYLLVQASPDADATQQMEAARRIATCHEGLQDWDRAIAAWESLAAKTTDHLLAADALIRAGDLHARQERLDQARTTYEKVLALKAGWSRLNKAQSRLNEVTALQKGDQAFWIDPYVLRISPTSARMYWASRGEAIPDGEVTLTAGETVLRIPATRRSIAREPGFYLHSVALEGMQPHTRYQYTARCGDTTRTGSFLTALPATDTDTPFTFAVYGDTQDQPNFHAQVAQKIADAHPAFVLHVGDMIGDGGRWNMWKTDYFDPAAPLVRQAPIIMADGNHDGSIYFYSLFLDGGKPYYDIRYGNTHIFVLDSYGSGGVNTPQRQAQLDWLSARLAASDARWKIAITHYVMIDPNAEHWTNWGRDDFFPLLERHGVDLFFSGHIHDYRRLREMATAPGKKPLIQIITGGGASAGGDTGKGGKGLPIEPSPLTVTGQQALHYCLLTVAGNRLTFKALQRDGSIIDQFELVKENGVYQPEVMARTVPLARAVSVVRHYSELGGGIRRRISADIGTKQPDGTLSVTFTIPALPPGVSAQVETAPGNPWTVTTSTYNPDQHQVRLSLTPPAAYAVKATAFAPALAIRYTLRVDDMLLEADTFTLIPRQAPATP